MQAEEREIETTTQSYWREWVVLIIALATTAGSLYLSMGMKLKACPFCFYQRTFVMGIAAVLLVGLFRKGAAPGSLLFLCIPLAFAGLGVAAWHVLLESTGRLVCPYGIAKIGTAPQQSLAAFVGLTVIMLVFVARGSGTPTALLGTTALGIAMAYLCVASSPPAPHKPENIGLTSADVTICEPIPKPGE